MPPDEPKLEGRARSLANLKPYKPGETGCPGGKPVGTRNKLQTDFLRRLSQDFERFGIYAIARVRRHDPAAYVRVVASLMPKELEITRPLDDVTDEQLDAAVLAVRTILAAKSADAGAVGEEGSQSAEGLSPVPEAS